MEVLSQPQTFGTELPQNSLAADFYACLVDKKFSDVTFIVKDQAFHSHKLVLSARSKYFQNLLAGRQGSVEVEIQNASPDIFRVILEYMYTDLAFLDMSNVWGVHTAAQYYNLEGLTTKCVAFLIDAVDANNVFEVWKCSQGANIQPVIEYCVHFISKTFHTLLSNNGDNLQDQHPDHVQRHVTEQMQQQPNQNDNDGSHVIEAIRNYKFPSAGDILDPEEETSRETHQAPQDPAPKPEQQQEQEQAQGSQFMQDFPSWTQTFELLDDTDTPPAAFPTAESLSAFPEFFFDQSYKPRPDQAQGKPQRNQGNDQAIAENEGLTSSQTKSRPETVGEPSGRRGSLVTRRLSVVSDPSNLGVVFQYVISCVTRLMDADRTSLFLYDRTTDELCSQVAIGECEIRIPSDKGIAGSVFRSGKSVNVKDAYSDSQFNSNVDKNTGYNTRCVLCSPIISRKTGNIVGVIEVLNKHSGPFNMDDEVHMKTVAALFAILVDDPDISRMSRVLVPPSQSSSMEPLPLDMDLTSFFDNQGTGMDLAPDWQSLFHGVTGNESINPSNTNTNTNLNTNIYNMPGNMNGPFNQMPPEPSSGFASTPMSQPASSPMPSTQQPEQQSIYTQFAKPQQDPTAVQETHRTATPSTNNGQPARKSRKRKRESVPFMHFRIPRYELQFIPYSGGNKNTKQ